MRHILACMAFISLAAAPQVAAAQDASFYRCDNRPVRVDIAAMPLGDALKKFTNATRCPVSLDVRQVANADAHDVPTARVKGRMSPDRILRQMLSASPLKAKVIKGGFSIYMK